MSLTYYSGHPHRPGGPLTGPIANDARSQAMALAAAQGNTEILRQLALGLLDPRAVIDPGNPVRSQANVGQGNRYHPISPFTLPGTRQSNEQASRSPDPPNRTQTTRPGRLGASSNAGACGYRVVAESTKRTSLRQ